MMIMLTRVKIADGRARVVMIKHGLGGCGAFYDINDSSINDVYSVWLLWVIEYCANALYFYNWMDLLHLGNVEINSLITISIFSLSMEFYCK
ncbi:hypothetical protein BVRB_6g135790 [Beta vulgaris subsp. vulgaris]|nr:hypothetical protein BVRB_6g135790 [Beta vulgaris subsp. vulgaris]